MTIDNEFVASLRSGQVSDEVLRASLVNAGWNENIPAIKDENGTLLVGNRRMKIALEENLTPVVVTVAFGTGPEADAARARIAIVSNTGSASLTAADRKRTAERLYQSGMTQAAIGKIMGVGQATVSRDLEGVLSTMNNTPPRTTVDGRARGGRPRRVATESDAPTPRRERGAPRAASTRATPTMDQARMILRPLIEAGQPTPARRLEAEHGISHALFDSAIAAERARLETLRTEVAVDPALLGRTAQERLAAALRSQERRLNAEFERKVQAEVNSRLNAVLPRLKERERVAQLVMQRRRGVMKKADYDLIQRCLHPDSLRSVSVEKLTKAFRFWDEIKPLVLDETQSETPPLGMPSTLDELLAQRQRVREERARARRPRST